MPDITIKVSDAANERLERKAQEHNDATGAKFTLPEWIAFHLRELITADDLAEEAPALERQFARDHQLALRARKNELMDALAVDSSAGPVIP